MSKFFETSINKIGFGRKVNIKRIFLLSLILFGLFISTGFSLFFWVWPENIALTMQPHEMIEPDNSGIIELNSEFNSLHNITGLTTKEEVNLIVLFLSTKLDYQPAVDYTSSFALHHYDRIDTILERETADQHDRSIVLCSIVRLRGYEAYVYMQYFESCVYVFDDDNFVMNYYGTKASSFLKFNEEGTKININSMIFQFVFLSAILTIQLIIINYVLIFMINIPNIVQRTIYEGKKETKTSFMAAKDKSKSLKSDFPTTVKNFIYDSFVVLKANIIQVSIIVIYFFVSLTIVLYMMQILGFITGVWGYDSGYLGRGIRLTEQGVYIVFGLILVIIWISLFRVFVQFIYELFDKKSDAKYIIKQSNIEKS